MNCVRAEGLLKLGLSQTSSNGNDLSRRLYESGAVLPFEGAVVALFQEVLLVQQLFNDGVSFRIDGVRYVVSFVEEPGWPNKYTWDVDIYPF